MPAIERATQPAAVLRHQPRGVGASAATGTLGLGGCLSAIEHSTPGGIDLTWGCPRAWRHVSWKGAARWLKGGHASGTYSFGGSQWGRQICAVPARGTSPPGRRLPGGAPSACQPPASVTPGWAVLVCPWGQSPYGKGRRYWRRRAASPVPPLGGDLAHPMEHGDVALRRDVPFLGDRSCLVLLSRRAARRSRGVDQP